MCLCVNYEGEVVDAVLQYLEGVFSLFLSGGVCVGRCICGSVSVLVSLRMHPPGLGFRVQSGSVCMRLSVHAPSRPRHTTVRNQRDCNECNGRRSPGFGRRA